MLFPSDLTSFFELIRQHGNTVYSLMFAYASSHSLLLTLFAGYASHSGALSLSTVIAVCWAGSFTGDVTVRGGTAAIFELSGTQATTQLLELRSAAGVPPANIRVAIVRVQ